ncbi:MAG: hypothetical protein M3362_20430 [Acidobacteriota bacterium]|nr:hypothetical protein [Acidobacteriota bacterium]
MPRYTLRLTVALLTFLVGVAASSVFMVSRIADIEEPPCRSCSAVYSSSEIPAATVVEISADPEAYRGRLVRVRGIFHRDAAAIHLLAPRGGGGAMYAGLAETAGRAPAPRRP